MDLDTSILHREILVQGRVTKCLVHRAGNSCPYAVKARRGRMLKHETEEQHSQRVCLGRQMDTNFWAGVLRAWRPCPDEWEEGG